MHKMLKFKHFLLITGHNNTVFYVSQKDIVTKGNKNA
jgi:hypothetical protein